MQCGRGLTSISGSSGAHIESLKTLASLALRQAWKLRNLMRIPKALQTSYEVKLFLFVAIVYALTILPLMSSNEKSRFALTRTMVFDHSLVINRYTKFVGIDVSRFQGNYYSTMAPGVSILLIPFFILGTMSGAVIDQYLRPFGVMNYATPSQVVMVQLFSSLCTALSTIYVFKLCIVLGSRRSSALATGLVYAFATPTWVFGKTLFAHTFSALFLAMAYYYALLGSRHSATRGILLVGFFTAISLSVEYTNALLVLPALIYLLPKLRRNARNALALFIPVVASASLLLLYNYLCFRNPFTFPESYWLGYGGKPVDPLSKFSTPLQVGLQGLLLSSSRGLLLFSPVTMLAIPSLWYLGKSRRLEAIMLGSAFLINLLTFSAWYMWSGGSSYGPRFLVPSLPFIITPLFALLERIRTAKSRTFRLIGATILTAFFVVSASITSIGAVTAPTAGFSDAPFLAFLANSTGYPTISKGTLKDLGYVILSEAFRLLGMAQSTSGLAFWVCMISIPCLAYVFMLRRCLDPRESTAPSDDQVENPTAGSYTFGSLTRTIRTHDIRHRVIVALTGNRLDLAIMLIFWIVAFSLRYWNHATIPVPRGDELGEGRLALRVLQGYYPLTNNAKFIGSFFQYILAAFYLVFGTAPSTARLMAVFFGASTVAMTYVMAKDLYDRKAALISSTLLTFSVSHILIASHVGWSASLTPFFGILSIYLVNQALRKGRKMLFLIAGVTLGITLQTHPSSIFLLLGVGIHVLSFFKQKPFPYGRRLLFAASIFTGFALGYVNMIYFNLLNPLASLSYAQNARWTGLSTLTIGDIPFRFQSLSAEYLRMMGELMVTTESFGIILTNSKAILYLVLTLVSIAYALKRHQRSDRMLLLSLACAWLVLPIGVKGYGFPSPWGAHYVSLLLPISYTLISVPMAEILYKGRTRKTQMLTAILALAILFYAMATSLWNLSGIYSRPPR